MIFEVQGAGRKKLSTLVAGAQLVALGLGQFPFLCQLHQGLDTLFGVVRDDAFQHFPKVGRCVETRWKRRAGKHIVQRGLVRFAAQAFGVLGGRELRVGGKRVQ